MKFIFLLHLWFKKLRTVVEAKFVNARTELWRPELRYRGLFVRKHRRRARRHATLPVFGRVDTWTNEHYRSVGFPLLAAPRAV